MTRKASSAESSDAFGSESLISRNMPVSKTPRPPGTLVMRPSTCAATNAPTVSGNGGRGSGIRIQNTATASPQSTIDNMNCAATRRGVGSVNSTPKSRIGPRATNVATA